ncbi:oxidoreductase [Membranihabitans marinus]|uniref:oxidoreductase n=1 Tax=Membranihabitans marinus TaxID=1227546 RepID=UPI001F00EBEF|nr:oxidoreductase [Membranihabitans marinus]
MSKSNWDKNNIPNLNGRNIIITGASSGLGKEASRILSEKNARVIMAVRNVQKAKIVAKEIRDQVPNAKLDIREMDLSSLQSIMDFSDGLVSEYKRIDVLINNAGIMACPFDKTKDGFEIQMGTNHLGHFALTGLMMPLLQKANNARIVATSSLGHKMGKIDFEDIHWEKRKYNSTQAYADSKLANLYFSYELGRKLESIGSNIKVTAAHPGWTRTNLQKHSWYMRMLNPFFSQGPDRGVLPTLRAAFDSHVGSGNYFGPSRFFEMHGNPVVVQSSKLSHDGVAAKKLWELSEQMTNIKY